MLTIEMGCFVRRQDKFHVSTIGYWALTPSIQRPPNASVAHGWRTTTPEGAQSCTLNGRYNRTPRPTAHNHGRGSITMHPQGQIQPETAPNSTQPPPREHNHAPSRADTTGNRAQQHTTTPEGAQTCTLKGAYLKEPNGSIIRHPPKACAIADDRSVLSDSSAVSTTSLSHRVARYVRLHCLPRPDVSGHRSNRPISR